MRVILYLLPFAIALSPEFPNPFVPKLRLSDILIASLILILLGNFAYQRRLPRLPKELLLPILLVLFLNFLSFFYGIAIGTLSGESLRRGIYYLGKRIEYLLLFFLAFNSVEVEDDLRLLVYSSLLASLLTSLYAIIQFRLTGGRATGTIEGQPNILGAYLLLHIALAISLLSSPEGKRARLLFLSVFFLGTFAILYTFSRGTFVSLALLLFFSLLLKPSRKFAFALSLIFLLFLFTPTVSEKVKERIATIPQEIALTLEGRITSGGQSAFADRYGGVISGEDLRIFKEHPWWGYGMGYLPLSYFDIWIFHELTYNGILGTLAFLGLLFFIVKNLFLCYKNEGIDDFPKWVALGLLLSILSLLIHSLTCATFYVIRPMEALWLLTGATLGRALYEYQE
jgi:O-antigen ligase